MIVAIKIEDVDQPWVVFETQSLSFRLGTFLRAVITINHKWYEVVTAEVFANSEGWPELWITVMHDREK